nr:truncated transposase [uncultured bacterium]
MLASHGDTDEHHDGRRDQALDCPAQVGPGHGNLAGQDDGGRGQPAAEIEDWIDNAKAGMENALRAKPEDIREQYERQLKDLQEAYGEAMLELRARKKLQSLLGKDES